MCLGSIPVKVKNYRPLSFRSAIINAPCGHCYECKLQRQNDWALRSFLMSQDYTAKGGRIAYITFTYNCSHLPQMKCLREDGSFYYVSTWSSPDVKNFFKRLRKRIVMNYFDGDYKKFSIKYVCFCERGSDRIYKDRSGSTRQATRRPHYHAIIWFPPIPAVSRTGVPFNLYYYLRTAWAEYHRPRKGQIRGSFSSYGNLWIEDVFRNPAQVTKYITKYCAKSRQECDLIPHYKYFFSHNRKYVDSRDFVPTSHISKGVGKLDSFLDTLRDSDSGMLSQDFIEGKVPNAFLDHVSDKEKARKQSLPNYYRQLLCRESMIQKNAHPSTYTKPDQIIGGTYYPRHKVTHVLNETQRSFSNGLGDSLAYESFLLRLPEKVSNFRSWLDGLWNGDSITYTSSFSQGIYKKYINDHYRKETEFLQERAQKINLSPIMDLLYKPVFTRLFQYVLTKYPAMESSTSPERLIFRSHDGTCVYRNDYTPKPYKCNRRRLYYKEYLTLCELYDLYQHELSYQKCINYYLSKLKFEGKLPQAMRDHPELFEFRYYDDSLTSDLNMFAQYE